MIDRRLLPYFNLALLWNKTGESSWKTMLRALARENSSSGRAAKRYFDDAE